MSAGEIAEHAMRVGVDPAEVTDWAEVGGCGKVGEALLRELRPSIGEPAAFSVGAVSVLAGVLLATQAIKDTVRRSDSVAATKNGVPLDGELSRFVLNLYSPSTMSGVRRYRRDASCPACGGVRAEIWARRWSG